MGMSDSKLSIEKSGEVTVIRFLDENLIDEAEIRQISGEILQAVEESVVPRILIDFAGLKHLSSAAIGTLVSVNNRVEAKDGKLRLANIAPMIYEVFTITKLDSMFAIHKTADEAMAKFA